MRPMGSLTFLTDISAPLVADTSVVINLIATGCAPAIVRALPSRLVVVDVVPAELDTGRRHGRHNFDCLNELVDVGLCRSLVEICGHDMGLEVDTLGVVEHDRVVHRHAPISFASVV